MAAPAPTEYVVLRTIAHGKHITHLPTAERIVPTDEPITDYHAALTLAYAHRSSRYQHRETGDERVLTESQTIAATSGHDQELLTWLSRASPVETISYALPLERAQLGMFEPKPGR